ncbi:acyl-CoA N-acyltransferase [Aspergillus steynii IBT 23096]|uniref:Acyl-CoA N-acyltransferase n=1 Tax=Aspergillus steynii IBT 23096 TaxID=1392250 RepID=A0A2I2G735_9EURO|nr:acyl-CoA N-acyltransferase [Aspergillus steynii IBT 23096]PLB48681.1 acyl-CoA N-acyltransferase [Aspergillus steynii IBT 23096]
MTCNMSYTIQPSPSSDVRECLAVSEKSYAGFHSALYHTLPLSPESIDIMVRVREEAMDKDPQCRAYKAVDSETGAIIGVAKWSVYPEGVVIDKTVEEVVEARLTPRIPEMREDVARGLHSLMNREMRQIMAERNEGEVGNENGDGEVRKLTPHVHVDALFTHPDHQRKGIGKALLQTCLREANELGLVTFLEATEDGRPLYEKSGFKVLKECVFDAEKFGGFGGHEVTYMKKLPEKVSSNTSE